MSELTPCNYCSLQTLRDRAKAEGKILARRPDAFGPWGGGLRFHMIDTKDEPLDDDNFCAWLAEVPDHCVC
jgi:hypothetical protein